MSSAIRNKDYDSSWEWTRSVLIQLCLREQNLDCCGNKICHFLCVEKPCASSSHSNLLLSTRLMGWKDILSLFHSLHQSHCSGYDKGLVYVSVREGLACPILSLDIALGASFKASYLRSLALEVVSISLKLLLPNWTSWYCIHFHYHDKILI